MRVAIVHTADSPCRCAEAIAAGLEALGHEPWIVDSEEIERHALALARTCDLVIDHTDTFRGRGLYRPQVRLLLENSGARVIGAPSSACFLSDNKVAAKRTLAQAGVPVPPGIVVDAPGWKLPRWLRPPLVLKPAFEHMSRGVRLVQTASEAQETAEQLLDSLRQPIMIESYVAGRELAISLLGNGEDLEVLPVAEWEVGASGEDILTEQLKLIEGDDERHRIVRAALEDDLALEIEAIARRSFAALQLRDYARFDARLSPQGSVFILEANTTPSFEPREALSVAAQWAGMDYARLVERILQGAASRYRLSGSRGQQPVTIEIPGGVVELATSEASPPPPQSSRELAHMLDVRCGESVLELGCGTGLLAISAAKLGAARVVATDVDPDALHAAEENARRNGVADRVRFRAGSWYEALGDEDRGRRFDVIIATPPQTPGPLPFGPKYGGPDGARNLLRVIDSAPDFLDPERGRLWLLAISLANPTKVLRRLEERFRDVVLARETERRFTIEEYEALCPGLFAYLDSLRSAGVSEFAPGGEGRRFRNLFIRAARPKSV